MALPNSAFTELTTTAHRNHKKQLADNVSNHNALLKRLNAKGRKRVEDGGNSIACPLDYAENGTYQRFSGYDPLNIQQSDVLTTAEYNWRQIAVHVIASGEEIRKNSGSKTRILNLVKERVMNAHRTYKNNLSSDLYSDGTSTNQVNGLQAIIPDTAGGTVGGISGSSFTFWQAVVQSAASPISGSAITLSETTFEKFMRQLYIELTRGDDMPDLIPMSNDYYELFEGSQVSQKRYTTDTTRSQDNANAGLVSLKYKNADVVHDGGSGIPSAHMYMLNTDYLEWVVHRDADMTEVPEKTPVNQDASVMPIITMCNLTCSNRSLQGVGKA